MMQNEFKLEGHLFKHREPKTDFHVITLKKNKKGLDGKFTGVFYDMILSRDAVVCLDSCPEGSQIICSGYLGIKKTQESKYNQISLTCTGMQFVKEGKVWEKNAPKFQEKTESFIDKNVRPPEIKEEYTSELIPF